MMLAPILLMIALSSPSPHPRPAVQGDWRTPAMGGATIRFTACGQALCGRIVAIDGDSKASPKLDENNPDPTKRSQPLVGKMFISGMQGGPAAWRKGKIYHPPSGRTVAGTMRLIDPQTIELEACMMLMCRKSRLTRLAK